MAEAESLTRTDRLRRVVILCGHFMRNHAYYRTSRRYLDGWKPSSFWHTVQNNFADMCVLEWCKLFGDSDDQRNKSQHGWEVIVTDRARRKFKEELLLDLKISEDEFEDFRLEMRTYRDKFVAHLDKKKEAILPLLDSVPTARRSVEFYHAYVVANEAKPGDLADLPDTEEELREYYQACEAEAAAVYCAQAAHWRA